MHHRQPCLGYESGAVIITLSVGFPYRSFHPPRASRPFYAPRRARPSFTSTSSPCASFLSFLVSRFSSSIPYPSHLFSLPHSHHAILPRPRRCSKARAVAVLYFFYGQAVFREQRRKDALPGQCAGLASVAGRALICGRFDRESVCFPHLDSLGCFSSFRASCLQLLLLYAARLILLS